jgi:8-oxo-dGTP pyrophosphatase MutT (NUDIX family)
MVALAGIMSGAMAAGRSYLPWLLAFRAFATPVAFGVSAILDDPQGRILLVRQRFASGWHFPGGGVERGEPPTEAIVRELEEEVGLQTHGTPVLHGLYTRTVGIATNVVALYRVPDATISFSPNREILEIMWADPLMPPAAASPATLRRFAELTNKAPPSPYW